MLLVFEVASWGIVHIDIEGMYIDLYMCKKEMSLLGFGGYND